MNSASETSNPTLEQAINSDRNSLAENGVDGKEEKNLPSYVYKSKLLERESFLKESSLVDALQIRMFNAICEFASLSGVNSPMVNLQAFADYCSKKKLSEFSSASRSEPLVKKIEEALGPNGIGVFEITQYSQDGAPTHILLSERDTEQVSLYKKVEKYLVRTLAEVKSKKGKLKTDVDVLKEFKLYSSLIRRLFVKVKLSELSQQKIKELAKNKFSLVVIDLDHSVGRVVFLADRLESTILFFVVLVYEYYEDSPNDNLRHLIKERLNRQKLNSRQITAAFKKARLQDNYFLFFSQLFFTIMNNLMQKFTQQNVINTEVFNQLVASRILSILSFNQREIMRREQASQEMVARKLRSVLVELVVRGIKKGGEEIYYPLTMNDLRSVTFKAIETKDGVQQEILEKIKDVFKPRDIEKYFESLNNVGHSINEVISFSAGGEKFYVHRTRILQSFWAMIAIEAAKVRSKIVRLWSADIKKMLLRVNEVELERLIEQEMISNFFRSYAKQVHMILLSNSSLNKRRFDSEYMLSRFFFTERERARFPREARKLLYKEGDFKKKKNFLKSFFNTVMNKNYSPKGYRELFKLNLSSLKEETLLAANVGGVTRATIAVIDILRNLRIDALADIIVGVINFFSKLGRVFSFRDRRKEWTGGKEGDEHRFLEEGGEVRLRRASDEYGKRFSAEVIRKNPEVKNKKKVEKLLADLENKWNTKLGDVRYELKKRIDIRIDAFVSRCDPQLFIDRDMDAVLERFVSLNRTIVAEITDKESLRDYLYYKAVLVRVG